MTENEKENTLEEDDSLTLNGAYDRVSSSGVIPSAEEFLDGGDGGHLGREAGEIELSDSPVEMYDERSSDENLSDKNPEEEGEKKEEKEIPFSVKSLLDGSFLTHERFSKFLPYIAFLVLLSLIYIANRNIAESLIKKNMVLKREVRELRAESIVKAADLMAKSKETVIAAQLEKKHLGIHERKQPPLVFFVDRFERADSLKTADDNVKKRRYVNDFNVFEDDYIKK